MKNVFNKFSNISLRIKPEVKRTTYISKLIACSMLAVILYVHVCSVWCTLSMGSCAGMSAWQKEDYTKSCCKENHESNKGNDCQAGHVAFFSTTGKFFTVVNKDLAKPFSTLAPIVTNQLFFSPFENYLSIVAYNGFHPPPPKAGIRILIASFQI
ncbi:MAG: hypothetical protein LH473_03845 [Chitinophagales bacterium]|nr:hypothetical protein [Chitinophagales bacterium]